MAQDPEVKRVIAEFKRTAAKARAAEVRAAVSKNATGNAWTVADDARKAAHAAWEASGHADAEGETLSAANTAEAKAHDRSARAHYVWDDADALLRAAEYDLEDALDCQTFADLLGCENSKVRMETQFALNPAPPAPKRKR